MTARRRRKVAVYEEPRNPALRRWVAVERRGDLVDAWHGRDEAEARRAAGLRPKRKGTTP